MGYGILAPSRHNAQPWLFEIEGDSLHVFADRRRALRAADPHGREAAIACGAALENVRVAAAHHGHAAEIDVAPGRRGDGPLGSLWLGERQAPAPAAEELFRAIPLRRTASALRSVEPQDPLVAALGAEVAARDCSLRLIRPAARRALAELAAEADVRQWGSPRFRAEHALWTRAQSREPARERAAGVLGRLLRRFSSSGRELERRIGAQLGGMLLLSTRGDEPADWVAAGRALQAVLLRAAAAGLDSSYLSAPLEVPDVRARLRRTLFESGYPQVLLRLGRGLVVRPPRRRHVDLVLRGFAPAVVVPVADEEAA